MNILVINAGSSSLKYQLMDPETGVVTAKGLCERIGLDGRLTHKVPAQDKKVEREIPTRSMGSSPPPMKLTPWAIGSSMAVINSSIPASSTRPASRPSGTASLWVPSTTLPTSLALRLARM